MMVVALTSLIPCKGEYEIWLAARAAEKWKIKPDHILQWRGASPQRVKDFPLTCAKINYIIITYTKT